MSQRGGFSPDSADRVRTADGRRPALPWRPDELAAARAAYEAVAALPLPGALAHLPRTGALLGEDLAGWRRLRSEPDPALAGEELVHGDARADNLLVRPTAPSWSSTGPGRAAVPRGSTGSPCSSTSA